MARSGQNVKLQEIPPPLTLFLSLGPVTLAYHCRQAPLRSCGHCLPRLLLAHHAHSGGSQEEEQPLSPPSCSSTPPRPPLLCPAYQAPCGGLGRAAETGSVHQCQGRAIAQGLINWVHLPTGSCRASTFNAWHPAANLDSP